MKAIITVDVPEHQIGQEVSVYFKDTMCVRGTCESEKGRRMTRFEQWMKENGLTRPEMICQLTKDCSNCPLHRCMKTKAYSTMMERYLDEEVPEENDE